MVRVESSVGNSHVQRHGAIVYNVTRCTRNKDLGYCLMHDDHLPLVTTQLDLLGTNVGLFSAVDG